MSIALATTATKPRTKAVCVNFPLKSKIITFHKLSGLRTGTVKRRPPKLVANRSFSTRLETPFVDRLRAHQDDNAVRNKN